MTDLIESTLNRLAQQLCGRRSLEISASPRQQQSGQSRPIGSRSPSRTVIEE
jgi:hypothetical protein